MWNPETRKIVYSRDVVFREVKNTSRNEDEPKETGPEKMQFELKNEGSDSFEEESSKLDDEVEMQTPALTRSNHVRRPVERYIPLDFHYAFVLSTINDEPRSAKEALVLKNVNFGRMPW